MYCQPSVCAECAKAFTSGNPAVPTYFCSGKCRDVWNNRRKLRGALLMDMMMILRFDRDAAREEDAWTTMCRMASDFRGEDIQANRASVNPRQAVRERTVEFRSVTTKIRR
jgi:predicted nucleic acid-binding Zn ribbon protein